MLRFKGSVQFVKDETRDFPVKDKDGVPTLQMKSHRILEVMLLIPQEDKTQRVVVVKGFDFNGKAPKVGDTWETPEVRRYDAFTEACPVVQI